MTTLTTNEKVLIDSYFVKYNIAPNKQEFISAVSNTMPKHRVYAILGHDSVSIQFWKPEDECVAYNQYIEEILSGKL